MSNALTIAGVDSGGGAGIAADLKTFAALGVHGTCVVSSVTAQNTTGVLDSYDIPVEFIEKQFDAVVSDIRIDCAKTGMLSSPEIVDVVAKLIKDHRIPLVIDPVMAAEAGGELLKKEAVRVLIEELLPLATVVTPNVYEAEILSGIKVLDLVDAEKAALKIHDMGAKAVIVTGGHLKGTDILYDGRIRHIDGALVVGGGTHGSGCTHSAALTAELAKGVALEEAAVNARKFVEKAIISGMNIGSGVAPVNPLGYALEGFHRYNVLKNVDEATLLIEGNADFAHLIPEVGCNIAMGIPEASSVSDVAAIPGRIVWLKGVPRAVGCVSFGASSHIARIVLTAMHFDRSVRAAMNIRYSEEVLNVCNNLRFKITSFSRKDEPKGISTMEWGVAYAIESADFVPDMIYDKGDLGKEPMIRILGKDAKDVVTKALQVSGAMMRRTH